MKRINSILFSLFFMLTASLGQQINLTGLVVNSNNQPVENVLICLKKVPDAFCYSDQEGKFNLTFSLTGLAEIPEEGLPFKQNNDGSIEIITSGQQFVIDIVDLTGRPVANYKHTEKLNGTFVLFPDAYIQNMPIGIYIARITIGNYHQGFKISNINPTNHSKGIYQIADGTQNKEHVFKNTIGDEDTLVLSHEFYKTTKIFLSNPSADIGTVILDNFGDYSLSDISVPDKINYYPQYGNFIYVLGNDSSQFILNIDPNAISESELNIRAIPVRNFNFIDPSFRFISGIHLEPSGTDFYFPLQVNTVLKNIDNIDSLIIVMHNNVTNKISYLPYRSHIPYQGDISMNYYISHFSDIAICKGEIPSTIKTTFTDSDDAVSYIASLLALGVEIDDKVFTQWYNDVIQYEIASIIDMESLKYAVHDIMLMAQYAIYANKLLNQLSVYSAAIAALSEKVKDIFDHLKEECNNLSDPCLLKDLALIAVQLNVIAQKIDGLNEVPLSELCNGKALELVNKITFLKSVCTIIEGEAMQVEYSVDNIQNEKITADLEWYSDDPEIATVDKKGNITAIKEGHTRVHAKSCDVESSVVVYVQKDYHNPCFALPRPLKGMYHARVLMHNIHSDGITLWVFEYWKTIDVFFTFAENSFFNDFCTGVYHEVSSETITKIINGEYQVIGHRCNKYFWNIDDKTVNCSNNGDYSTRGSPAGKFYIYPNSNTVKVTDFFVDREVESYGILEKCY